MLQTVNKIKDSAEGDGPSSLVSLQQEGMALTVDTKQNVIGITVPPEVQAWRVVGWVKGDDTVAGAMSKDIRKETDKALLRPRENGGVLWSPVPRPYGGSVT